MYGGLTVSLAIALALLFLPTVAGTDPAAATRQPDAQAPGRTAGEAATERPTIERPTPAAARPAAQAQPQRREGARPQSAVHWSAVETAAPRTPSTATLAAAPGPPEAPAATEETTPAAPQAAPQAAPPSPAATPSAEATPNVEDEPAAPPPTPTASPAPPAAPASPPPAATPPPRPAPVALAIEFSLRERGLFEAMNEQRASRGVHLLQPGAMLTQVARARSQDMIEKDYFAHFYEGGLTAYTLLVAAGATFAVGGENLAKVYGDTDQSVRVAIEALMDSSSHRDNILDERYRYVGVGSVTNEAGMTIFTMIFTDR